MEIGCWLDKRWAILYGTGLITDLTKRSLSLIIVLTVVEDSSQLGDLLYVSSRTCFSSQPMCTSTLNSNLHLVSDFSNFFLKFAAASSFSRR
jgi:hypothetical protein